MSGVRRSVLAACVVLALAAGFALASCGGDEAVDTTETTATTTEPPDTTPLPPPPRGPTVIRVRVVGGVPNDGIVRKSAKKGDRVVLIVTSDVRDHVHVHGYNLFRDVGPGRRARISFRANIPGRFAVELEDRHAQIAELTVEP